MRSNSRSGTASHSVCAAMASATTSAMTAVSVSVHPNTDTRGVAEQLGDRFDREAILVADSCTDEIPEFIEIDCGHHLGLRISGAHARRDEHCPLVGPARLRVWRGS